VPTLAPDSADARRIDDALRLWRQGDLALDERWFVHVADPSSPLTEVAAEAGGAGLQALTSEVAALAIISQTCDIVRTCSDRPYVEVSPVVHVRPDILIDVQRGRRPSLATLPVLSSQARVVDLDRVMTVEKSIVATWQRTPGYATDAEGRTFAQALARKRVRFAFPDDFVAMARRLQGRLVDKHDRNTDEGRALRALREIRVHASPSWDAPTVELFFWFVRHDDEVAFDGRSWATFRESWLALVQKTGRFVDVDGQIAALEDMTGAEYVGSDPLDFDHLSSSGGHQL
jgi:hypothetical protein